MSAYPALPTAYLHPPTISSSGSASSVEPLTPPLGHGRRSIESDELDNDDGKALQPTNSGATGSGVDDTGDDNIQCRWKDCQYFAPGPEELYVHLCESHIGRKSTNNLCLTCGWEGCGVKCVKRDHITSHLRVHTPLKPHPCSVCGKTFKRPQDLKKHERIHTQEHHQLHKLSKAQTSTDPDFNSRYPTTRDNNSGNIGAVNRNGDPRLSVGHSGQMMGLHDRSPASLSLSPLSSPHDPTSPFDRNANYLSLPGANAHTSVSLSPSPSALAALHKKQHAELAAYQAREILVLEQLAYQQHQSSTYAAQLASETYGPKAGLKRGQEDAFDSFVDDMKKRRMEPVYDGDMISRLNTLMPPGLTPGYPSIPMANPFNPITHFTYPSAPSVSITPAAVPPMQIPDIRTEADLAMFNQFMVSLGREATSAAHGAGLGQGGLGFPMEQGTSGSGSGTGSRNSLSPISDNSPIEDLFDSSELASLGLAGMPGIPVDNNGNNLGTSIPGGGVSFSSLYPSLDTLDASRPRAASASEPTDMVRRPIAGLPRAGSTSSTAPRPSYTSNLYGLGPGQYAQLPSEWINQSVGGMTNNGTGGLDQNYSSFDSLGARSRASLPAATLAPRDFYKRTYRNIAPLGAAPNHHRESAERTGADEDDDASVVDEPDDMDDDCPTPRIPIAALLDGDPAFKLPAIGADRSASATSLPSIHQKLADVAAASSPVPSSRRGSSPAHGYQLPVKRHTDDYLVHGVKRLELDDRRRGESPAEASSLASGQISSPPSRPSTATSVAAAAAQRDFLKDMRRRHAALIRAWLVAVNLEFKRKQLQLSERPEPPEGSDEGSEVSDGDELDERESDGEEEIVADEMELRRSLTPERIGMAEMAA